MDISHSALIALLIANVLFEVVRWLLELPAAIFHGYSAFVRTAADSVHSLFESYGYWVIFLGTLSENTLLLGLIIPGAFVVILAGLAAAEGDMSLPVAIALGIAGTCIGDTISYFMGRFGWGRLAVDGSARQFTEKVREPILRRGAMFVVMYHFAGYTRVVGPASAGVLRMPYRRWAPADHLGAALWVTSFMLIGYGLGLLGFSLDSSDRWFRYIEWGLLAIVAVWGYFMFRAGERAYREHLGAHDDEEATLEAAAAPAVPEPVSTGSDRPEV